MEETEMIARVIFIVPMLLIDLVIFFLNNIYWHAYISCAHTIFELILSYYEYIST